jgi:hypothetical protein
MHQLEISTSLALIDIISNVFHEHVFDIVDLYNLLYVPIVGVILCHFPLADRK